MDRLEHGIVQGGALAATVEPAFAEEPAEPAKVGRPDQRRVLSAGISSWTLMAIGTLGLTPFYPDIARSFGLKADSFGAVLGIATLTGGILQIPMGVASDRFKLKYISLVGLVAAAGAPVIWALAPDYRVYAVGQLLMGVCTVCLQAGFHTAIAKAFRDSGRSTALSMLWVATSLGAVASLLLYGQIGGHVGWRAVALATFWLPLLAVPLVLRMPDIGADEPPRSLSDIGRDSIRYLVHGRALALAGVIILGSGTALATQYLIPFVLRGHAYKAGATGLLLVPFIVGGLVGAPLMGRLADTFGAARPVAAVMILAAASLATISLAGPQPVILIVGFVILGAQANGGLAVLLSSSVDVAAGVAGVGAGSALGITRLAMSLGPAVSPTITGFLFLRTGGAHTEMVLAGVLLVGAVSAFVVLAGVRSAMTTGVPAAEAS